MSIADEEIIGGIAELKREISEQEYSGYTGNAGQELTRWYHRAAVVMWPSAQHAAVLCGGSLNAGLAGLKEAVRYFCLRPKDQDRRSEACAFATVVLNAWPTPKSGWSVARPTTEPGQVAALLAPLGDVVLATRYVTDILRKNVEEDPGSAAVDLAAGIGWPTFLAAVATLFCHTTGPSCARDARLLATLCHHLPKDMRPTGEGLAARLVTALVQAHPEQNLDGGAVLQSLVGALHDLDAQLFGIQNSVN